MMAVPVAAIHQRGAVRNMINAATSIEALDVTLPVADHRSEHAIRQQPLMQALRTARGRVGRQQHEWHCRQAGQDHPDKPQPQAHIGQQQPRPAQAAGRGRTVTGGHDRYGVADGSTANWSSMNAYISANSR